MDDEELDSKTEKVDINLIKLIRDEHILPEKGYQCSKELNLKEDTPFHAEKLNTYLCFDSRKESCPYYVRLIIDTPHLSFYQGLCGYSFRKG